MMTRLEFLRRKREITQKDLGTTLGEKQPVISSMEKGKTPLHDVKYGIAKDLEKIFGEPIEALLSEME